ncbi:hypothetical protein [Parasediminibacterium sp. JCM 36343]|uniref:hypothetical protein n=1 Tax=Parasediminibacterium sp. JCM 36343 TaxID=3374279 RepID=UPI003978B8F8
MVFCCFKQQHRATKLKALQRRYIAFASYKLAYLGDTSDQLTLNTGANGGL